MSTLQNWKKEILNDGFTVIPDVYSESEITSILDLIENVDTNKANFRKTNDLFAIRQFLKELPDSKDAIFTQTLKQIIEQVFGNDFFVVKTIYFDKPTGSNWYVSYHQDLTISVDKKIQLERFGPWTVKQNHFAVQPPQEILENNFTIRIHLDDTDENNGALRVLSGSHKKGIARIESLDMKHESEITCSVPKGGIMIMKPLLFHASGRAINNKKRRVIHIEFSNCQLPSPLNWSEYNRQ